jgi:hypothetical protein
MDPTDIPGFCRFVDFVGLSSCFWDFSTTKEAIRPESGTALLSFSRNSPLAQPLPYTDSAAPVPENLS